MSRTPRGAVVNDLHEAQSLFGSAWNGQGRAGGSNGKAALDGEAALGILGSEVISEQALVLGIHAHILRMYFNTLQLFI